MYSSASTTISISSSSTRALCPPGNETERGTSDANRVIAGAGTLKNVVSSGREQDLFYATRHANE